MWSYTRRDARGPRGLSPPHTSVAMVLLVTGACTPSQAPAPQSPAAPPAAASFGDTSAAYAGHHAAPPGPRQRPAPVPVTDRDAAFGAVTHSNPEGAIDFLAPYLAEHPDELDTRLALARAQIAVGRLAAAQTTLRDPNGSPNHPHILRRRAQLLWRQGQADAARTLLELSTRDHPSDLPLRGEHLELLVRLGQGQSPLASSLRESLYDAYETGQAQSAADLVAVAQAALSRGTGGAFHDANGVLQDAEDLAPVEQGQWVADDLRLLRASMFLEKYAEQDAAETFELILARDSWHTDALVGMARVHLDGLRFADASTRAHEALAVDPQHPDAHAILGRIALIEGRRDEARQRAQVQALSTNPQHLGGLAVLASLAIAEHDDAAYAGWRDRALAVNPRGRNFFIDVADTLSFLHLYPETDQVLQEGAALAPEDPYIQSALGLNRLRLGQEQAGRQALALAWSRDKFNERTRNMLDLYHDTIDPHYDERVVDDLVVRLPKQDYEFIEPGLVASIQRSRDALDTHYGMPAGALRLEFFSDPQSFSVRTIGVPSLGALAVCFGPVITFVGPFMGAYNIDMVIRHELGHTYAIALSQGRVPRWFTEGLSEWESELADPAWARESAELLSQARRAGTLRRLSELELAFIRAQNSTMMEVAYATAAYAMRYLGQTYGRPALIKILKGYRSGAHTDALFREHLGQEMATIEREFEAWFFDALDHAVSGWEPTTKGSSDDPRDALLERAKQQAAGGARADAIQTLEQLIDARGDGYIPRMMLAELLINGPKPAAAVAHLEAARRHHKEAIEPLQRLATLARTLGDTPGEKAYLQTALSIDGDSLAPAARLLMLGLVTDDQPSVNLAYSRVSGIAPLHPIRLAAESMRLAASQKSKTNANKYLRRALRDLEPGRGPSDTLVVVALAAQAVGNKTDAVTLANAARKDAELPKVALDRLTRAGL